MAAASSTSFLETHQIHNSTAKESSIPSSPVASSSTGLIPRRERLPTTPNIIFGRVVSILARLIVGAQNQFETHQIGNSIAKKSPIPFLLVAASSEVLIQIRYRLPTSSNVIFD